MSKKEKKEIMDQFKAKAEKLQIKRAKLEEKKEKLIEKFITAGLTKEDVETIFAVATS